VLAEHATPELTVSRLTAPPAIGALSLTPQNDRALAIYRYALDVGSCSVASRCAAHK